MKRISTLILLWAIVMVVSCKDDFNDEQFLQKQLDARKAQIDSANSLAERERLAADSLNEESIKDFIESLNQAGELLSLAIMVRENNTPLAGVTVTLTTASPIIISSGRSEVMQSALTDTDGRAVFDKVTIGSGALKISKTGYLSATATVDFGKPEAPISVSVIDPITKNEIKKFLPPAKRFEEAILPIYSSSPGVGSTATITGRVTIENDVTNLTSEIPVGTIIKASFTGLVTSPLKSFISDFAFEDNSSIGTATVSTDGTYSMTVPATAAGVPVDLIVPNIEGTSRMAVNSYDDGSGQAVALTNGPEYKDVPTSWGPDAPTAFGNIIPNVAGAKLVFPIPPPAGSGLSFDYGAVPSGIGTGNITSSETQQVGGTFYRIISRGTYANGSNPVVTVTGNGQGATAIAIMRTSVSTVSVTNPGAGYLPGTFLILNIVRVRQDNSEEVIGNVSIAVTQGGTLPALINLSPFQNSPGFNNNPVSLATDTKLLKMTVTKDNPNDPGNGAAVSGVFQTELQHLFVSNGGNGYTSPPTFTFTGGGLANGSVNHASVQVVSFPTHWFIAPNNTNASDYAIMPSFVINYPPSPLATIPSETNIEAWSLSGLLETTTPLMERLSLSFGDVVKREPNRTLRTIGKSSSPPTINVIAEIPSQARRTLTEDHISAQGSIESLPNGNSGNGYNSPVTVSVQPTIAGAPGSGATISLTNNYNVVTGEYTWTGAYLITNPGSGYLRNLNRKSSQSPVFPTTILAQPRKTYTVDISYGTGNRKVNVN
jgi:hypothetical protein